MRSLRRTWGWAALLAALTALAACGENPDRLVSSQTEDGRWQLSLETHDNELKRGESAAVRVRLESLAGQPATTFRDTISLIANAGVVTPNRLVFTFVGTSDTTYVGDGLTTAYTDWVTFTLSTLSTQANEGRQGEVIAIFRDVQATLKLRIVED